MKPNDVIGDCDNTGATTTSKENAAVCPISTQRAGTSTPTLTELVTEQAKGTFCGQVEGTDGTPGSSSWCDCHGLLVLTSPLDRTIQIEI